MPVGLSTYAFTWRSKAARDGFGLIEMVDETAALGAQVLQICDYAPIDQLSDDELQRLRRHAEARGITLELGTRGISTEHLARFLHLATQVGATFVRSMLNTASHRPAPTEAVSLLTRALPAYADRGVTLGLETYEQVATADLVDVIRSVDSPHLGICLDPANSVARLEHPASVIESAAPYVVNMHIKDFTFRRRVDWVGFELVGCPLGTGLLDYESMIDAVRPGSRNISQIVEHWLPGADSLEETCRLEEEWTRHSASFLLSRS